MQYHATNDFWEEYLALPQEVRVRFEWAGGAVGQSNVEIVDYH
jgi:hypothetical protein